MSGATTPRPPATEGFLVITKTNQLFKSWGHDTPYKGVYNVAPWYRDPDSGNFFDDPRVHGEYEDESGLIRDLTAVGELVDRLVVVWPRDELETIFARHWRSDLPPAPEDAALTFIGYDVAAGEANFFSLCADEHFDEEYGLAEFATLLNEYRLFQQADEAGNYLDAYLALGLDKVPPCVVGLVVWEIYLVQDTPE